MTDPDGHTWWSYDVGSPLGNATFMKPHHLFGEQVLQTLWYCIGCGSQGLTHHALSEDPHAMGAQIGFSTGSCTDTLARKKAEREKRNLAVVCSVLED